MTRYEKILCFTHVLIFIYCFINIMLFLFSSEASQGVNQTGQIINQVGTSPITAANQLNY